MSSRRAGIVLFITVIGKINSQSISDSINAFTIDLLAETSNTPESVKNLALSPYTIWTLLAILNEGANGTTAEQLETVLRVTGYDKNDFRSSFANFSSSLLKKSQSASLDIFGKIFTDIEQTINPINSDIKKYYNIEIQRLDFTNAQLASETINNYVAQGTRNRITNFVRPEDVMSAKIFVLSALYFKGLWQSPFRRNETRNVTFYDEESNKLGDVSMMYQMSFFPYARLEWIRGYSVELPYGEDNIISMILILPFKDQTVQGILDVMKQTPFRTIIDKLNKMGTTYEGQNVQIYLPKFKVESDLTLNRVLQKMGIVDLFIPLKANLLKLFPDYLYVSRMIQRAEIEVNEEGTVASAASGAELFSKAPPPKFIANRPFLYFIVNKLTKSIIFGGKITVPPQ